MSQFLPQSTEMNWLALTLLMTALLWVPYILRLLSEMGPVKGLMDGEHATPVAAAWAQRAKRAHANAVENLVIFAPLVLAVEITGARSDLTALAAQVYFWARLVHYVVYVMGLPVVRTLAFAVGFLCQLALVHALL